MSPEIRLGVIGCSEGTHGKAWAELLSKPEGQSFGMRPARVWDADPVIAQEVANAVGAACVADSREAGEDVDGVLIAELYPENYLELSRPFLEAGKRVFFNRPFAGSIVDAKRIVALARKYNAKIYSASALYHTQEAEEALRKVSEIGPVRLFSMTGPRSNIYLYLPHAIASLVSVLGTGVKKVCSLSLCLSPENPRESTAATVIYVEYGTDSAAGAARGVVQMIGPDAKWYGFHLSLLGEEAEEISFTVSYDMLLESMSAFFRTGIEPVPPAAILEKTAIFHAALLSANEGGRVIDLADLTDD